MTEDPESSVPMARGLARGVCRLLSDHGYTSLLEFTLKTGRRVDVMGIGEKGEILAVEIKTSVADFRADTKWPDYEAYCERFYFATPRDFPHDLIPLHCGLIVADAYGGVFLRDAEHRPLPGARRKALTLRFARLAGQRLGQIIDPR